MDVDLDLTQKTCPNTSSSISTLLQSFRKLETDKLLRKTFNFLLGKEIIIQKRYGFTGAQYYKDDQDTEKFSYKLSLGFLSQKDLES